MTLWAIFATSTALLGAFGAYAYHRSRTDRVPSGVHVRLDAYTQRAIQAIKDGTAAALHFARSDVLLKGLHMVTYVALMCVRVLERQLVRVVHLLRGFRKERTPRRSMHKLANLHAEEGGETVPK